MDIEKTLQEGLSDVKATYEEKAKKYEADLEALQTKMEEQAKNTGEVEETLKNQNKNLEEKLLAERERIDAIEKAGGRLSGGGNTPRSFKDQMIDALSENKEQMDAFKEHGRPFAMQTKAVITEADAYTNDVVPADYVPGFKFNAERQVRVRQFLPQGTTSSDKIRYIQESNYTDGTATSSENNASGQSDFDLTATDANVTKISAHFRVSKEALNDTQGLASHISLRGSQKYMNEEDAQLLYGGGTGADLDGLTTTATDYTLDAYTGDANAQEYDVLLQAIQQIRTDNYNPSAIMVSISRYFEMIQRKDADGQYIFPQEVVFGNQMPRVMGVPIVATNAINSTDGNINDFLVADFPQLTTLFDREGMSVRFYEQDQDNVIKDLVTVQISGRLALPTYLPDAGRFGNFATAIQNAGNS